jgi:predicted Zn-dependent protease with MMP-like domain
MTPDRHGRAARSDNDRRRRPSDGYRVRDERRFLDLVEDVLATLPQRLLDAVASARVTVEDVPPPPDPHGGTPDDIPLSAFDPAGEGTLIVYRRPLELRAVSRGDLDDVVRLAVGREVARVMGIDDDLDDLWGDQDW